MPSVEGFKHIGVLITSKVKMEHEIDRGIGGASAVMCLLYRSVVVKEKLSKKAKASIDWLMLPPRPMVMSFCL